MDALLARAAFVFRGRVESLGTTTTAAAAASELSSTVRVVEVIRAPQALQRYAGQLITVELSSSEGVEVGASFVFLTRPKVFADTLVVTEIGRQADTPGAAAESGVFDSLARVGVAAVQARIDSADAIVVGRVSNVRPSLIAAATPGMWEGLSEHDPAWMEAVVQVDSVMSGDVAASTPVTILFPSSIDIAWYNAPKYAAGQRGVFLLHSDQVPAAAAEVVGPTYTTLHPQDFHPDELEPQLRALVERSHP